MLSIFSLRALSRTGSFLPIVWQAESGRSLHPGHQVKVLKISKKSISLTLTQISSKKQPNSAITGLKAPSLTASPLQSSHR